MNMKQWHDHQPTICICQLKGLSNMLRAGADIGLA